MSRFKAVGKDHIGAALLIALGVGAFGLGLTYRMGTLNHMGAGYVPVVLGVLMVLVGLAIGLTATPAGRVAAGGGAHGTAARGPEWRGWLCIVGGVIAFVVVGQYGGLVAATFASIFIAALGDRQNTVKGAAALAVGLDAFGVLVFHYGLQLQLPLFAWG